MVQRSRAQKSQIASCYDHFCLNSNIHPVRQMVLGCRYVNRYDQNNRNDVDLRTMLKSEKPSKNPKVIVWGVEN